jgi:hypothetical protein
MKADVQQIYPPEPPLTFPPTTLGELAEQRYPPEPSLSFPPQELLDVEGRGLRAEAHALTMGDLSELSVGHAKVENLPHVYMAGGLLLVAVAVLVFAVGWRKGETKKTTMERSVAFTDSYEPFLG